MALALPLPLPLPLPLRPQRDAMLPNSLPMMPC